MIKQLICSEKFTNIQKAQSGLTRLFEEAEKSKTFYRVLKNDQPLGVLVPNNIWIDLIEDFDALSSPNYIESIKKARSSKKRYSLKQVEKELEL